MRRRVSVLTALNLLLLGGSLVVQVMTMVLLGTGPERDALFVATSVPLFLNTLMLASFGAVTTPAVLAHVSVVHQRHSASRLLLFLVVAAAIVAVLLALLRHPLAGALAPGFSPADRARTAALLGISILNIPLQAATSVLGGYWLARERVLLPSVSSTLGLLVTLAIIAAVRPASGVSMIIAITLGNLTTAALVGAAFVLERNIPPTSEPVPRISAWLVYRKSIPLGAANSIGRAGPMIERAIASQLELGTISQLSYAGQLVSSLVAATTAPLASASYAQMCRDWRDGRQVALLDFLRRWGLIVLAATLGIGGVVILTIHQLLDWLQPHTPIPIREAAKLGDYCITLMPAFVALSFASFLSRPLYAAERFFQAAIFDCIALAVYIAAAVVLSGKFGGLGLAFAFDTYAIFQALLISAFIHRNLGLRLGGAFWLRAGILLAAVSAAVIVAWLAGQAVASAPPAIMLSTKVLVFALICLPAIGSITRRRTI